MKHRPPKYLVHQSDLDRIDRLLGLLSRFVIELIESRQLPNDPEKSSGYDEFEAYIETLAAETDEERQVEFHGTGRRSTDF
jgi:hypothetical protein